MKFVRKLKKSETDGESPKISDLKGDMEMGEEIMDEVMEDKFFEFENCIPVYRDGKIQKWTTSMTAEQLGLLYRNEWFYYDYNLQRGYKETKSGLKPLVNQKHVKEILEAAIQGTMHGGQISLCYFKEYPTEIEFDEESLTLSGNGKLAVLDGFHRISSFLQWIDLYEENPSIPSPSDYSIVVVLEYLTYSQAQTLFSEYSTKPLKISNSRSQYLDVESIQNKIARRVMNESELKNKVEIISSGIKKSSGKLMTFSVLVNGIKNNFKPSTEKEGMLIADHLISFFNEIINLFPEQMGNDVSTESRIEWKQKSFATEVLVLYAYFGLAKEFYNTKKWAGKLKKLKSKVTVNGWSGDFLDKSNPVWKPVLRNETKIVNTTATQNYVQKIVVGFIAEDKSLEELMG